MSKYTPTIGLEIHAELKTQTKMFCDSANIPLEEKPNTNVCPVCMGHPGTLPTINKEAVLKVLLVGKAIDGKLAKESQFDRKNYFYPDLPKGYQISQYKHPLVEGGKLSGIKITRVHLEEDTGKLVHGQKGDSLVDYNRAGVPLLELVTEPDVKSSEVAREFAYELQLLLRYLDASDANMEKGQMRIEANISVSKNKKLGTKVEVKNLNSFRSVERAIEHEIERQSEVLEDGGKIIQETRGWDENKQVTVSQREKENAHDYRYLPEPDLPKMDIESLESEIGDLPELPNEKRGRFKKGYGVSSEAIEIFINYRELAEYFEAVIKHLYLETLTKKESDGLIRLTVNYLTTDLLSLINDSDIYVEEAKIVPENFAAFIRKIYSGEITSRGAKEVLKIMFENGGYPEDIIKEKGFAQTKDEGEIKKVVVDVIKNNPKPVADFKEGKESALKFLVGQGMAATKGSANPQILEKIFKEML